MTETPPPACPECRQPSIPIIYGYPGLGLFEAAKSGELVLGGCCIWDGMPTWRCAGGHDWNDQLSSDGKATAAPPP